MINYQKIVSKADEEGDPKVFQLYVQQKVVFTKYGLRRAEYKITMENNFPFLFVKHFETHYFPSIP